MFVNINEEAIEAIIRKYNEAAIAHGSGASKYLEGIEDVLAAIGLDIEFDALGTCMLGLSA